MKLFKKMKKVKNIKPIKNLFKDKKSFESLNDLVGRVVILTFKYKAINQYKRYEIIGISEGFLRLKGIEQDVRRPRSAPWYQAVSSVDTIEVLDEK